MNVELDAHDIGDAIAAATASSNRYRSASGYYPNKLLSHVVGHVGEMAAERLLTSMGLTVDPHWRHVDREALCDLQVSRYRIEVKTWTARWWTELGRCVAVGQVEAIAKKAGVILWATAAVDWSTLEGWQAAASVAVTFHGYSTLNDVRAAPVRRTGPAGRQVENFQLDAVRPLGRLIDALQGLGERVPCPTCGAHGCIAPTDTAVQWTS